MLYVWRRRLVRVGCLLKVNLLYSSSSEAFLVGGSGGGVEAKAQPIHATMKRKA
ncbi:MAG: hypothetical protein AOA66_0298 [Candidatus Bathyarchaeota archaeon BA2]|nr:MAG: hypothetical protein AOA66_0298 [Candidatus Bathyarchaeota archaeon BA2]